MCVSVSAPIKKERKQREVGGAPEALNGEIPLENDIYAPTCAELTTASLGRTETERQQIVAPRKGFCRRMGWIFICSADVFRDQHLDADVAVNINDKKESSIRKELSVFYN